jgi:hypothetical protein
MITDSDYLRGYQDALDQVLEILRARPDLAAPPCRPHDNWSEAEWLLRDLYLIGLDLRAGDERAWEVFVETLRRLREKVA